MLLTYIAVALVALLLIGFVVLAVVWTARSVSQSIRGRSFELLGDYDALLEEKSQELDRLKQELKEARDGIAETERQQQAISVQPGTAAPAAPPAGVLKAVERLNLTDYLSANAGATYRKIRTGFVFSPQEALELVRADSARTGERPASRLLEELDYDTVYRLSILPGETQRSLLEQTLTGDSLALLQAFCDSRARFDCVAFYDALRTRAALEPSAAILRVPPGTRAPLWASGIRVVEDPAICEGFRVEANNRLYDYSISAREIG